MQFNESPEKRAGIVFFIVFMLLMAACIILANHAKVNAQDTTQAHSEASVSPAICQTNGDSIKLLKQSLQGSQSVLVDGEFLSETQIEEELRIRGEEQLQMRMTEAVMNHLIHCVRRVDGAGVIHPACRNAKGGCEVRIYTLAGYIIKHAKQNGIDPWLLAAIAFNESNWNPFAKGPKGSRGFLQINPKIPAGRTSKFVQSEWYRKQCRRKIGNCQDYIAHLGAQHFARDLEKCNGSIKQALTRYNTGRCLIVNKRLSRRRGRIVRTVRHTYVNNVLRLYESLQKGTRTAPLCDGKKRKAIKNNV